jgi:hypothetical protein
VASLKSIFPESKSYDVEEDEWRKEVAIKSPQHGMGAGTLDGTTWVEGRQRALRKPLVLLSHSSLTLVNK